MKIRPNQRRFHLQRDEDETGVSGPGRVAEGCQFSNGVIVLEWLSTCASTNRYANEECMMQVHGHGGKTKLVWDDPDVHGPAAPRA